MPHYTYTGPDFTAPRRIFTEHEFAAFLQVRRRELEAIVATAGIPFKKTHQGAQFQLLDVERALSARPEYSAEAHEKAAKTAARKLRRLGEGLRKLRTTDDSPVAVGQS